MSKFKVNGDSVSVLPGTSFADIIRIDRHRRVTVVALHKTAYVFAYPRPSSFCIFQNVHAGLLFIKLNGKLLHV